MPNINDKIEDLQRQLDALIAEVAEKADSDLLDPDRDKDLPIDTPVTYQIGDCWYSGYFAGWDITNRTYARAFRDGKTSYSARGDYALVRAAKRDYTAKSILNWIPNNGRVTKAKCLLFRLKTGSIGVTEDPAQLSWSLRDGAFDIKEYAIIEP